MAKVIVNPGKTLSVKGVPRVAGSIVEVDNSQVKRLIAEGVVSDPSKPLLASPATAALAGFKANPPIKTEDSGKDASNKGQAPTSAEAAVQAIVGA